MKCHKCAKSLQDETAVDVDGVVYCYPCSLKVLKIKSLFHPPKDKMMHGDDTKVKTKEKRHYYTG